ncbi:MAG: acyl-CoA thioesterase [Actinobacteria bacterium]|nr:acyl-CoA thioesterase [Actinomycetota bacterium]
MPSVSDETSPRRVADSRVVLVQQMAPADANVLGSVHGGTIMKLVDTAAGLAASKHVRGPVVTVAMDEMSFLEPVLIDDVVTVKAAVNDVGRTSLEVGARVDAENYVTGRKVHVSSAYLVFVALDTAGRPRPVPPILAESEEERQRQREARLRREARLSRKRAIEEARRPGGDS